MIKTRFALFASLREAATCISFNFYFFIHFSVVSANPCFDFIQNEMRCDRDVREMTLYLFY